MTKKRRKHPPPGCRSVPKRGVAFHIKRARNRRDTSISSMLEKSGAAPETVAHFQALQTSTNSVAIADVFEWLGDAVLGEMVGRCLLSQFRHSPVSARVFRNLRLAVVTNWNLAQVFDAMGYAMIRRPFSTEVGTKIRTVKERADVVEAIVGELVLTLYQQKTGGDGYRIHLDAVVATMLHLHFAAVVKSSEEKGEMAMAAKGPLSVACNPFACLPREDLDEITGELVVIDGDFEDGGEKGDDEYEFEPRRGDEEVEDKGTGTVVAHHYFAHASNTSSALVGEGDEQTKSSVVHFVQVAMRELHEAHLLRTSSEFFEVFKIYGMAVLSERTSLSLALPYVSVGSQKHSDTVTPAKLTRQRQLVLSVANLAACAILLGVAEPVAYDDKESEGDAARQVHEEHGRANTLRAFVGYHSAVATTSASVNSRSNEMVNAICTALHDVAFSCQSGISTAPSYSSMIPEREPLMAMRRSVSEAHVFMSSKTCDGLHARGERPASDADLVRERNEQSSLFLRQCDSNELVDLFETLNGEQEALQKQIRVDRTLRTRRKKKKKCGESITVTAGSVTPNLERFLHRRFLYCLEDIVILFAQRKTEACRAQIVAFRQELEPCLNPSHFQKWEVSTSTLTLALRDSNFRLLLHDICHFHAIISFSRNTRDGTRITQLRLPLHYTWANIGTRVTTEQKACS